MSDLSSVERLKIEALFGMESGYILGFSNNTFSMFTVENVGIDIFDSKYEYGSSSKANRLRKFWLEESNEVVGKLLSALLDYWLAKKQTNGDELSSKEKTLYDECQKIVSRLNQDSFRQIQENTSSPSQKGGIFNNGTDVTDIKRPLKVFLCHAHADRDAVRTLYTRLTQDGVDAWLDEAKLLPGQDREHEIRKAVRAANVVVVCLSKQFNQAGIQQKEVRIALDTAMEQLEGDVFIVPARLEECDVPESLQRYHWVDLFDDDGYEKLLRSLRFRDEQLELVRIRKEEAVKRRLPFFETPIARNSEIQHGFEYSTNTDIDKTSKHLHETSSHGVDINGDVPDSVVVTDSDNAINLGKQDDNTSDIPKGKSRNILSKILDVRYVSLVITIIVLIFGNNIYAQITGHSIFVSAFTPTATLAVTNISPTSTLTPDLPMQENTTTPVAINDPYPDSSNYVDTKGIPMRLVPAGNFIMGSDKGGPNEQPVHKVNIKAFYIDKYEVTNRLYKECVNVGVCNPPNQISSKTHPAYYGNVQYDNFPVIYVDWYMSQTYCEWRGMRLPTEAEWEKASRSTDGRMYPWGNLIDHDYANYDYVIGDVVTVGSGFGA